MKRALAALLVAGTGVVATPAVTQGAEETRQTGLPANPRLLDFPAGTWRPPTAAEHRIDLAGGATAFVVEDPTLPLVDIVVVARVGAFADPPDAQGLSELTSTMLRRGGTSTLEPDRFDQRVDELGAVIGSQATTLYGAATLRCTTDVLEEAVALFLDMLEQPRFDPARLEGIKGNIRESLTRRQLDPLDVLSREWEWLLFGEDHFSMRPLRAAHLEALTPAALAAFHRRHWQPGNFWIAAGGDVDGERLHSLLADRFRDWAVPDEPAPDSPARAPSWPPQPPTGGAPPGLYHLEADIPQAKVAFGHRAGPLPSVEERVELEVMAEILGGRGAISRLNGRLRSAEGLVYRASARLDPGDLWPGDYQMFFDTQDRNTPRALEAAFEEIDRLRDTPPHPEELATVKGELLARRMQEFDTAEEAAGYLVEDALVARPETYRSSYRELVEAVTPDDVLSTARRHLRPEEMVVLVSGRWPNLAGPVDAEGISELEHLVGHRVVHLPDRDPLTLLPVGEPDP